MYCTFIIKLLRNNLLTLKVSRLILCSYFISVIPYRCPLSKKVIRESRLFFTSFASLDTAENDGVTKLLGFLSSHIFGKIKRFISSLIPRFKDLVDNNDAISLK